MYLQSHCFRTYTPTTTDYHTTTTTTPYITSTSSTSSTTSAYTTDSDLHKGDDITYTPTQTSYTSTTSSTSSTSTTTAYPLTGQPGPAPIPAGNVNHNQHFFSAIKFSPLCHNGHKYYTVRSYHGLRWLSKTNLVFILCFLCVWSFCLYMYLEMLLSDQKHIDLAFTLKAGQIWSEPLSLSNLESLQF